MTANDSKAPLCYGGFEGPWAWYRYKIVAALIGTGVFLGTYRVVALLAEGRSVDLMTPLDHAIPFIPWTWWLYIPAYALGLLVAIGLIDDRRVFHRVIVALLCMGAFNSVFYLAIPSVYPRPVDALEPGLTAMAFEWLWATDLPNNTFPSSHVAVGALSVFVARLSKSPWALIPLLCAVSVSLSVLTTKQHYWVDSVSGWMVAGLAYWLIVRPVVPAVRRGMSKNI
jgi:membrane-associated phospholipid phosphatase